MENQEEFWQFSDQLRLQSNDFSNLSISDSIWTPKRFEERRNFDSRLLGADAAYSPSPAPPRPKVSSDFNPFNDGWKTHLGLSSGLAKGFNDYSGLTSGLAKGFNDYSGKSCGAAGSPLFNNNKNEQQPSSPLLPPYRAADKNFNNGVFAKDKEQLFVKGPNKKGGGKYGNNVKHGENGEFKKGSGNYSNGKNSGGGGNNNNNNQNQGVDKRFRTLPPSEALPRSEAVGGYIFVCNNDTMQENLRRQLFGLPPRYRDSVRAITPGLPLFLYNYSTHQLHGIFEAASFGGTNIDPTAWEDKKCPGESRFPAQVRVVTRNICESLEEDSFRPILHHYDGPKFRLELSVPEALALLDIFAAENNH